VISTSQNFPYQHEESRINKDVKEGLKIGIGNGYSGSIKLQKFIITERISGSQDRLCCNE
jgi:hypothetical protein